MIQKLTSACMIGFYVNKSFSLHIGFIETVKIHNQEILFFVNLMDVWVQVSVLVLYDLLSQGTNQYSKIYI